MIREDFAAAGGVSLGLRWAGIPDDDVYGVEFDRSACDTAQAAGHFRIHDDVRNVREFHWGQLDGYTAGPPCQTFSRAGKGEGRAALDHLIEALRVVAEGALPEEAIAAVHDEQLDQRSVLALEPMLVITRHLPRWVMLEQVPTVLPLWEAYAEIMRERGYSVETGILNSEQYGVPQTRRRAILVARCDGVAARLPEPTHSRYYPRTPDKLDDGVCKWVSMADALDLGADHGLEMGDVYSSHGAVRHADRPAPTIMASADNGNFRWREAVKREVEPRVNRDGIKIEPWEAGVLQSFPSDYPWQGTKSSIYTQVGNAHPPLMAKAIIEALLPELTMMREESVA